MGRRAKRKKVEQPPVCVMSRKRAQSIAHKIVIEYSCTKPVGHGHIPRQTADALVAQGDAEWYGAHNRVIVWVKHKIWAKTYCAGFGPTMQLIEEAEVYARKRRQ